MLQACDVLSVMITDAQHLVEGRFSSAMRSLWRELFDRSTFECCLADGVFSYMCSKSALEVDHSSWYVSSVQDDHNTKIRSLHDCLHSGSVTKSSE